MAKKVRLSESEIERFKRVARRMKLPIILVQTNMSLNIMDQLNRLSMRIKELESRLGITSRRTGRRVPKKPVGQP